MRNINRYNNPELLAMKRMMNRFAVPSMDREVKFWNLAIDVVENDDAFLVEASVPGVSPEAIDVQFEDGVLAISGERSVDETINSGDFRIKERYAGSFGRKLRFNTEINSDEIAANYANGVLTLTLPKAETVKPKKIAIAVQ